jgi:hypothetical protein
MFGVTISAQKRIGSSKRHPERSRQRHAQFSGLMHIRYFAAPSTIFWLNYNGKNLQIWDGTVSNSTYPAGQAASGSKICFSKSFRSSGGAIRAHVFRKSFPDGRDWYYFSPQAAELLQGFIAVWDGIPVEEPTDLAPTEKVI